jgi:hypothetical protein
MRWLPTILLCLLFSFSVHSQEVMTKTLAGPNDDQFRIAIAFMSQGDDNSYKLQSFILDINRVKKNEQPTSFYLDLTTTVRNLTTGAKKQKILVQRWKTAGDVEVKCEASKWIKQSSDPEFDRISETVRAVVQIAPLDAKETKEFDLPKDLAAKITDLLNGLPNSKLQCVRDGGPN